MSETKQEFTSAKTAQGCLVFFIAATLIVIVGLIYASATSKTASSPAVAAKPTAQPWTASDEKRAMDAEKRDIQLVGAQINTAMNGRLVQSIVSHPDGIVVVADADVWDNLSMQDQDLTFQTIFRAWESTVKRHHPKNEAPTTFVKLVDLAGNELKSQAAEGDQ